MWGSAGVQAYFVENEGGEFGPFEFEYRLDLGDSSVALRNTARTSLEVFDVITGKRIGQTDSGAVTVPLPGGEDGATFPTTFRITARCDDLWVQVEYLTRQIGEVVMRQVKPLNAPKATSWAAAFNSILSDRQSINGFVADTKRGVHERSALVTDLKQLSRFKERLATQYLLERQGEMVPRFKAQLAAAKQALKESTQRIGEIFGRSQRDVETNMPMIPPKYAKEYEANKLKQENAAEEIEHLTELLRYCAAQIKPRLASVTLYGWGEAPAPQILPPLGEEQLARVSLLHEYSMTQQIEHLQNLLDTPLRTDEMAAAMAQQQATADAAMAAAAEPAEQEELSVEDAGEAAAEETPVDQSPVDEAPIEEEAVQQEQVEYMAQDIPPEVDLDEVTPAEAPQQEALTFEELLAEDSGPQDDTVDLGFDPKGRERR